MSRYWQPPTPPLARGKNKPIHPNAPAGWGGLGTFRSATQLGIAAGAPQGLPHPQSPDGRRLTLKAKASHEGLAPPEKVEVKVEEGVYYVTMSDRSAMRPYLRSQAESFEKTTTRVAQRSHLDVLINGNMFDADKWKALRLSMLPNWPFINKTMKASETTPEGVVRGRGQELGGNSEPQMFYMAWREVGGTYLFGKGDPPADTTSALGGLGPLLINGLKYGAGNQYSAGVPDGAPATGEPGPDFQKYLQVRSNNTYKSLVARGPKVGKVVVGRGKGKIRIVVQPDGVGNLSLDKIRDRLASEGVTDAVFLDGSDSAMLMVNRQFLVHQGQMKDIENTIGIGFQLPKPIGEAKHDRPKAPDHH